eukprot:361973-Chlamydomonas_euryale.AAC.7
MQHNPYEIDQPWRHRQRRRHLRPPQATVRATDFCQLLEDAIALPDLLLAAAPDGCGHLRRDISHALMRLVTDGSHASTPSDPLDSDI